jgi:hypothetical protein
LLVTGNITKEEKEISLVGRQEVWRFWIEVSRVMLCSCRILFVDVWSWEFADLCLCCSFSLYSSVFCNEMMFWIFFGRVYSLYMGPMPARILVLLVYQISLRTSRFDSYGTFC